MKKRKIGLTAKYVIIACVILLAVNVALAIVIMDDSKRNMTEQMHMRMLDIGRTAALSVDGNILEQVTAEDVENKTERFQTIYNELAVFQNITELTYIYAVKQESPSNDRKYVFTVDTDPEEPGGYGEEIVFTEALYQAGKGTPAVDKEASQDRWGRFYSAFYPVYNDKKELVGIIGIDYSAAWYEKQVNRNTFSHLAISVVSLLVGSGLVVVITGRLRKRLDTLYKEASSLSVDVESLTEEITSDTEEYKSDVIEFGAGEADVSYITDIRDGDATKEMTSKDEVEALGNKIRSMQTELRKYIYFVHSRAYTDTMTGVGNKTAYFDTVRTLNKKIADGVADFCVTFCDINGLKTVNDNYGHELGDALLKDAANVMKKVFDPKCIYRIGGDEFIVVLEHVNEEQLNKLRAQLKQELAIFNENNHRYETKVSFSCGTGIFNPETDTEFRQVFKRADESMYHSKESYYNRHTEKCRRRD